MNDKIKIILGTGACMLIILVAMAFFRLPQPTYEAFEYPTEGEDMVKNRRISPSYARDLMVRYPNATILDVRTESEFAAGHIPGAILLPDFEIKDRARDVLQDDDALILIYCRSGVRSRGAMSLLLSMGYVNVYDFGGINSWPYEVVTEYGYSD